MNKSTLTYNRSLMQWELADQSGSILAIYPPGNEGQQAAQVDQLKVDDPDLHAAAFYLAADLFRGHPELQKRVWRAADIVKNGDVRPPFQVGEQPHTVARVKSDSKSGPQAKYHYVVTRSPANRRYACGCFDYESGAAPKIEGQKLCKHILAVKLMKIINRTAPPWPELDEKQKFLLEQRQKQAAQEAALDLQRQQLEQEKRAAALGAYGRTKGGTRIMEERQNQPDQPPTDPDGDTISDWFSYS